MPAPLHTLKSLAKLAGVSPQTVSLALRNHPTCNVRTRERIQQLAAKVGYRPDPILSKLMLHLRTSRTKRLKGVICGLTTRADPSAEPYLQAVIAGATHRAEALGFLFDVIVIDPATPRVADRLHRTMRARGVDGLLLLPMAETGAFAAFRDWEHYSVVCATSSVTAPRPHQVLPSHFNNTMLLCQRLADLGYRRPGLVTTRDFDRRVGHAFVAASLWCNFCAPAEPVPPLLVRQSLAHELAAWRARHQPDAIIAHSDFHLDQIRQLLPANRARPIGLACNSTFHFIGRTDLAGIDEQPAAIGAAAIDLLASLIQHGERGLPKNSRTTLIEGRFLPGSSAPKVKYH